MFFSGFHDRIESNLVLELCLQGNKKVGGKMKIKGKDKDHGDNFEIFGDHNECHDVRADIATSKNSFLISQGVNIQDSLGTQLNICVKCNKDGKLLVCSSSTCPLAVHEQCLGSAIDFDILTKFYCPFCVYSRAISHYLEAKKNLSLVRTELRAFLEPSKIGPRVETSFDENDKSCSKDQEVIIPGSTARKRVRMKKQDATCVPECTGTNAKSSNDRSEKCDGSRYSIRPRKKGRQIMEPIPQVSIRRKAVPWTNVEEQTLKEGVRRFTSEGDMTIPWKQIWEFGADVFQHCRNTIDLKDKWRNIFRRGPKK